MNKTIIALMPIIFSGCVREYRSSAGSDIDTSIPPILLFDSLIWKQYHCPNSVDKATYEWNWAYETREALGIEDIDSLNTLCTEEDDDYKSYADSGITFEMTTASEIYAATARFRMLNVYQSLANMSAETPLVNEDYYFLDYVLWEKLYEEFDYRYDEGGNSRFIFLNSYYRNIADLRTEMLYAELILFSNGIMDSGVVKCKEPHWDKIHHAIRNWYDHRMKMADELQSQDKNKADYIRYLTYKYVEEYMVHDAETMKTYGINW